MEEVYIIIPARIGSTRLPNKPLIDLNGLSLIQRVYLNASKISSNVFVATDSKKIEQNLSEYTSNIIMTSSDHISGTDRIYEAAKKLNIKDDSLIINLQGDEPFLPIDAVSQIIQTYHSIEPDVITLSCSLDDVNDLNNPNCVKVKTNIDNYALDFFRISDEENLNRHIGIYGYSFKTLKKLINLDPSDREIEYKLEQLRFLDNNFSIYVSYYDRNIPHGIDTDLDVINARKILNN
tara:strand:- start:1364 stop:2071 length:708 start_codon:yes stop_codon:yes gene_type:complete